MKQEELFDEGHRRYTWDGDAQSEVKLYESPDGIGLDSIKRGPDQPPGSAADLVSDAIKASSNPTPNTLTIPNVLQKSSNSTAKLSEIGVKAANNLGAKSTALTTGVKNNKHFVEIAIEY